MKRYAVALLAVLGSISAARAQETFPAAPATEVLVTTEWTWAPFPQPLLWASLGMSSATPFLLVPGSPPVAVIHPAHEFAAGLTHCDLALMPDDLVGRYAFVRKDIGWDYSAPFPNDIFDQAGITLNPVDDVVSPLTVSFVGGLGHEGYILGTYFVTDGEDGIAPNRLLHPYVAFAKLRLLVQIRDEDGTVIDSTHPFASTAAEELSPDPDILNAKFKIDLRCGYFPGGITPGRPVPNTETRVLISSLKTGAAFASPWVVSDANGRAESVLGAGTNEIDITGSVPLPTLFVELEGVGADGAPLSPMGYASKTLEIPDMRRFDGTLSLNVTDMDGNPLRAKVRVSGGPMLGSYYQETKTADASGSVSFHIPTDGTGTATLSADAHLAPLVYVTNRLTQIVDQPPPGALHDYFPLWFSPQLQLRDNAWSYTGKESAKAVARFYRNGTQDGPDVPIAAMKRGADLTERDKWLGIDRRFREAPVGATPDDWTCKVFFKDDDPFATEPEIEASGSSPAAVAKRERVPARDEAFHVRYVAVGDGSAAGPGATLLSTYLSTAVEGAYNDHFTRFFPGDVQFSHGPSVDPDLWFYEFDTWSISGTFRELETYRLGLPYRVDRIVGIVEPGGLASYLSGTASGLSLADYPRVVLLDPSRTLPHHLTHELLHTLGLPDDTVGQPSADGYDHRTGEWIHNRAGNPTYNAIMHDYAAKAWPRDAEYAALLDEATNPIAPKDASRAATERVAYVSALVERVPSETVVGAWESRVIQRAPLFVDDGVAWAPQNPPPQFPSGLYAYGVSLGTNGGALTHAIAYDYRPAPDINHHTGVLADNRVAAFFSYAVPWSDAVDTITMLSWRWDGAAGGILRGNEFVRSATAPTVAWVEAPPPASTLAGSAAFRWTASDPDWNAHLYAWPRISFDDGATWEPASGHFAIAPGESSFALDARLFPSSPACRVKILVSDDWHTAALAAGPYALEGYRTGPDAHVPAPSISTAVQTPSELVLPVVVQNIGTEMLELATPAGGQPEWVAPVNATTPFRIAPSASAQVLFRATVDAPGTLAGEFLMTTNDPARPAIRFPVSIAADALPRAPVCFSVGTEPAVEPDGYIPPRNGLVLVARDLHGNAELQARVTVRSLDPPNAILVNDQPMEASATPGEYAHRWNFAPSLVGRFGVEVAMLDPATMLADADGSNPRGDDFVFRIGSPNRPPTLAVVSPTTKIDAPAQFFPGEEIVLHYAAADPDGDTLALAVDVPADLPLAWDRSAGTLRGVVPRFVSGSMQVRLVARDPSGARAAAGWFLKIKSPTANPDPSRAIPDLQTGTVIRSATKLLAASVYTFAPQQGCRYDARPEGSGSWQAIALAPYTGSNVQSQYTGATYWDTSAIAAGARVDVRYVNVDAGGVDHPNPVVVTYRKAVDGAAIESVAVEPATLRPGQRARLVVEVRNESTETWTGTSGHLLKPPTGADPLTGLAQLYVAPDWDQVAPGALATYAVDFEAPPAPGEYHSAWQPWLAGIGYYGVAAQTTVVVAEPETSDLMIVR